MLIRGRGRADRRRTSHQRRRGYRWLQSHRQSNTDPDRRSARPLPQHLPLLARHSLEMRRASRLRHQPCLNHPPYRAIAPLQHKQPRSVGDKPCSKDSHLTLPTDRTQRLRISLTMSTHQPCHPTFTLTRQRHPWPALLERLSPEPIPLAPPTLCEDTKQLAQPLLHRRYPLSFSLVLGARLSASKTTISTRWQ